MDAVAEIDVDDTSVQGGGLTDLQAIAAEHMVIDGWTNEEIIAEAGIGRTTWWTWRQLKPFQEYAASLRAARSEGAMAVSERLLELGLAKAVERVENDDPRIVEMIATQGIKAVLEERRSDRRVTVEDARMERQRQAALEAGVTAAF